MPSGITPTLSMSYTRVFIRRNTKPDTGSRQSGSQRARTHGLAKDRANKPNIFRLQACFSNSASLVTSRHSHSTGFRGGGGGEEWVPCSGAELSLNPDENHDHRASLTFSQGNIPLEITPCQARGSPHTCLEASLQWWGLAQGLCFCPRMQGTPRLGGLQPFPSRRPAGSPIPSSGRRGKSRDLRRTTVCFRSVGGIRRRHFWSLVRARQESVWCR